MISAQDNRGGTPVGHLTELGRLEAASVMYLRQWADGPDAQAQMRHDFTASLGVEQGFKALRSFEQLCRLCANHGRRPLMRHAVKCSCVGSDESCFANFIATAAEGQREDTMLIATLLVRVDMAPMIASCAIDFGLALKRMQMRTPTTPPQIPPQRTQLH